MVSNECAFVLYMSHNLIVNVIMLLNCFRHVLFYVITVCFVLALLMLRKDDDKQQQTDKDAPDCMHMLAYVNTSAYALFSLLY